MSYLAHPLIAAVILPTALPKSFGSSYRYGVLTNVICDETHGNHRKSQLDTGTYSTYSEFFTRIERKHGGGGTHATRGNR